MKLWKIRGAVRLIIRHSFSREAPSEEWTLEYQLGKFILGAPPKHRSLELCNNHRKMRQMTTARWLNRALRLGDITPSGGVPLFLCPAILSATRQAVLPRCRFNHTQASPNPILGADGPKSPEPISAHSVQPSLNRKLPVTCSGCGAFSQTSDPHQLGYFDLQSRRVRTWMKPPKHEPWDAGTAEEKVVDDVLKSLDKERLKELGLSEELMLGGGMLADLPKMVCEIGILPFHSCDADA